MKKLIFAFIICIATSFDASAQTPPLNKQQTLDYINNLFKKSSEFAGEVSLEGKVMSVIMSSGKPSRTDLPSLGLLAIKKYEKSEIFYVYSPPEEKVIFWMISLESEALRLKKALEHLIELVKAEKSTDPFDD